MDKNQPNVLVRALAFVLRPAVRLIFEQEISLRPAVRLILQQELDSQRKLLEKQLRRWHTASGLPAPVRDGLFERLSASKSSLLVHLAAYLLISTQGRPARPKDQPNNGALDDVENCYRMGPK